MCLSLLLDLMSFLLILSRSKAVDLLILIQAYALYFIIGQKKRIPAHGLVQS